ncbi:MAG: cell division protein ZipA [Gammaproteobacteria bacterium]|nr:cell division protein ZipA [Gammaproteobacteria bacterium]
MDGLRWLLLFFGLLVIAGVYFYSRAERNKLAKESPDGTRREPTLVTDERKSVDTGDVAVLTSDDRGREAEKSSAEEPQKIVTLRLVARGSGAFRGDELILSLRGIGMRHGKFGIFHSVDGSDEERPIFSAASLIEPGSFDIANIKEQQIPGISLFLVLPGPIDGVDAFDLMMTAARALAQSLDGELLDESGSTLSIQRERYLREEIIQFQHSNLVA